MPCPVDPRRHARTLLLLLVAHLAWGLPAAEARWARHLVLSEVYGGGGNSGAAYERDFLELYNPTGQPVSLDGWSVQYASASGNFTERNVVPLHGTIPPFGTYLIAAAPGSAGDGDPLPLPDAESTVSLSATSGKVALVQGTEPISGPDDPNVIDFLGYGGASAAEGGVPAPRGSNARSLQRRGDGGSEPWAGKGSGWDAGENGLDWVAAPPSPRNSQAPPQPPDRPVAVIQGPQTGSPGMPVELDGLASWDPGGDLLTFRWLLVERPPESLAGLADPTAPRTTLVPDQPGTYRVELVVSDGLLESHPARATLAAGSGSGLLVNHGPNPARESVTFFYWGRDPGLLLVYDALGRLVFEAFLGPGPREYRWDLTQSVGHPVAAGLYLYLVVTEGGERSAPARLVVQR